MFKYLNIVTNVMDLYIFRDHIIYTRVEIYRLLRTNRVEIPPLPVINFVILGSQTEDPLEKEMANYSSYLCLKNPMDRRIPWSRRICLAKSQAGKESGVPE